MTTPFEPTLDAVFGEMSHWNIVCVDIDKTIADYERVGYRFTRRDVTLQLWSPERGTMPEFFVRSAWSIQGSPHIELGESMDRGPEPFLFPRRDHDYLDHVGYFVDDLVAASRYLEATGFPLELTLASGAPEPDYFCYHRTPSGARIELQDGPRFKQVFADRVARVLAGDDQPVE